jgi:hypothetical protein
MREELNDNDQSRGPSESKVSIPSSDSDLHAQPKTTDDTWIGFSEMNKVYYTALLGGFNICSGFISHPFTVISVRQQADPKVLGEGHRKDMLSVLRHSFSTFGIRGVFRGFLPMAVLGTPSNILYFTAIESSREIFQPIIINTFPHLPKEAVELLQSSTTAVFANFISLIPYVPAEVMSARMIVHPTRTSIFKIAKQIYQETGFRGFFKGFSSSFSVYFVSSATWWTSYSLSRRYGMHTEFGQANPLLIESGCGALSGLIAVSVSYPIDTIKTRIMSNPSSKVLTFRSVFKDLIRREGPRALFRGLPASLYSAAIGSTIFAASYETIKSAASTQKL